MALLWQLVRESRRTERRMFRAFASYSVRRMSQTTPQRLTGKVAVVTASSDGIGFAIAERLAQEGAKVVVSSRKLPNVERAVAQLKAKNLAVHGVKCHVGSADDRKALFAEAEKHFGGIDILVSNAAANPEMSTLFECSEAAWEKIFEINVKCSFLLTKEVVPYMRKRGGGSIVYVSSIAGYSPMQLLSAYSVSKTALFGLTKVAAIDGALENIRVNCVAPGVIETKFAQPLISDANSKEVAENQTLLKRIGQPHEIAGVVAFLVSDDSSYITGENIAAAGGMHSRL
ncbi:dehydrogenase/reductase SDR family member 4 isoform X2 [Phlebotomus argentipes]|uniref:dehydrogenase/reductase SDR family member 4 isoform X2 n=1 Tax=Phlebotomus argentipes TaxID=94469 RepID=UPI0028929FF6|nr:dehydrogenase/reductase SDR family member 4 isoform X2 [Phlebotomus argentipes]